MHLYRIFAIVIFCYTRAAAVALSQVDLQSSDDNKKRICYDTFQSNAAGDEQQDNNKVLVTDLDLLDENKGEGECSTSLTISAAESTTQTLTKVTPEKSQQQHHETVDGKDNTCSLYMAESSIPNAGLGVYTTKSLSKGEVLNLSEVILTHVDLFENTRMAQLFTETEAQQFYEIMQNKTDLGKECVVLALNGLCENDAPTTMTTECAKTCALHSAGLDIKKTLIFLKDNDDARWCKNWSEDNECTINPNYMLKECALSCVIAEYGLYADRKQSREDWLPSHYYWMDEGIGTQFEANSASAFVSGLGALPNSHLGLVNLEFRGHAHDNAGYHRFRDVGVGAFSSRHNITFQAIENVPAGMELFFDYGDQYFSSKTKRLGHVPLGDDYRQADNIIAEFQRDVQKLHEDDENENKDSIAASMYDRLFNSIQEPRLKNALPPNYEIIKDGANKSAAILSVPNVIRSIEWLEENGMCLDMLHAGPSTVSQAGRGAFASRSIRKGQVVSHIPLLHMDRRKLRRFVGAKEITPQLSINYSYGHENSSMVLLPYSSGVNFVNHNFDKTKVNVKLQWSSRSFHQRHWENYAVSEILTRQQTGLMMELVATQDIPHGHEIFLDYGSRWEKAWMAHVSKWKPPLDSSELIYDNLEDLNRPENTVIRTLEEQRDRPYGTNVVSMCWLDLKKLFASVKKKSDHFQWEHFRVERSGIAHPATDDVTKKCEIIQRHSDAPTDAKHERKTDGDIEHTTVYTVSVRFDATGSKDYFIQGIPRSEIFFENKKYASDQFLETAFRHVIDIPDDIFPKAWRDLDVMVT